MMYFKAMFDQGAIPVLEKIISFTEARHQVIANNIANVDTPNYRRRDLPISEFQHALSKSIEHRRATNPRIFDFLETDNVAANELGGVTARVLTASPSPLDILRHDNNNVSIDREMAELAKNTLLHNGMVQILSKEFQMLGNAISERITR
jgi:flagellar basal-body rod protein FlgB